MAGVVPSRRNSMGSPVALSSRQPEIPADPHDSLCTMTGIDHLGMCLTGSHLTTPCNRKLAEHHFAMTVSTKQWPALYRNPVRGQPPQSLFGEGLHKRKPKINNTESTESR